MSSLRAWLDGRRPAPPTELTDGLFAASLEAPDARPDAAAYPLEALLMQACVSLDAARARPEMRESAYELLAADALITYACEAALDTDDADASLVRLLAVGERR